MLVGDYISDDIIKKYYRELWHSLLAFQYNEKKKIPGQTRHSRFLTFYANKKVQGFAFKTHETGFNVKHTKGFYVQVTVPIKKYP